MPAKAFLEVLFVGLTEQLPIPLHCGAKLVSLLTIRQNEFLAFHQKKYFHGEFC